MEFNVQSQKEGLELMKHFPFRFTSLIRPMIYLFLFSLVYGYGELFLLNLSSSWSSLLSCLWLSLFGLGLYFVCTLIWTKKRKTLSLPKVLEVLGLCLGLNLFTNYCISPLSLTSGPLVLVGAFLGTIFLLFAIPTFILIFKAIYEDIPSFKEQFNAVIITWKKKFWLILNLWLVLFGWMYLWDNFMGGPLYSAIRFDAPSLFTSLIFLKEPTVYFEMILFFSQGAEGTYELVMLGLLEAILVTFLACNLISWFGQAFDQSNKPGSILKKKT